MSVLLAPANPQAGTLLAYAKDSQASEASQRVTDFNHFVIFDPRNILACHDFEFIDLWPGE